MTDVIKTVVCVCIMCVLGCKTGFIEWRRVTFCAFVYGYEQTARA